MSFQFQQFLVNDLRSSMKVGTDAIMLGAWTACDEAQRILEIGCGCGVIALMLAQRNQQANIVAIDIDWSSIEEASDNFARSPWRDRLTARHISLEEFSVESNTKQFDLIVSNPPFFRNSLLANSQQRTLARHDVDLPMSSLISNASRLLRAEKTFGCVLPYDELDYLRDCLNGRQWKLTRICKVRPLPHAPVKRVLCEITKFANSELGNAVPAKQSALSEVHEELVIEQSKHLYTANYRSLTDQFYL